MALADGSASTWATNGSSSHVAGGQQDRRALAAAADAEATASVTSLGAWQAPASRTPLTDELHRSQLGVHLLQEAVGADRQLAGSSTGVDVRRASMPTARTTRSTAASTSSPQVRPSMQLIVTAAVVVLGAG